MTRREKLERKLAKREEWAAGRRSKADTFLAGTRKYDGDYAFNTQPGHIPERARVIAQQDRAFENLKVADHHAEKAAGLELQLDRSVFSDDPDAIEALEARIAEREAECDRKAAWNSAWKKGAAAAEKQAKAAGKSGEDLLIARLDGGELAMREAGAPRAMISIATGNMEPGYSWIKSPFDLTHLRANIRRDRERVEEIRKRQARHARAEAAGGITIARSADLSWCTVTFAEKPSREVLDALKAAGFGFGAGSWSGPLPKLPECVREMTTRKEGTS